MDRAPARDPLRWPVAVALVLAAVATRVGFLARPFYNDAGLYAYVGKVVATGGRMYADVWETKPPGAALLLSLVWRACGPCWPAWVGLGLAVAMTAAVALARAAGRVAGRQAVGPAFLAGVVLLNFGPAVYTGFQLETVTASLAAAAAAVALPLLAGRGGAKRAVLVGVLAGTAAMVKPTAGAVAAVASLVLLCRGRWRAVGWIVAGSLVPTLAVAAWVWQTGIAGELPNAFRQIALYGSQSPSDGANTAKVLCVLAVGSFPILVRGWVFRRTERLPTGVARTPPAVWTFAGLWLALEVAGAVVQGRLYLYHFLPVGPPLALLYGLLPRSGRSVPVAMGLLPVAFLGSHWAGSDLGNVGESFRPSSVAAYLRSHTSPTDAIFADQGGRLLIETGRPAGSRYLIFFYWFNYDAAADDYGRQLLLDFDRRRPAYVVLDDDRGPRPTTHGLENPTRLANIRRMEATFRLYVADHYDLEAVFEGKRLLRRRRLWSPLPVFQERVRVGSAIERPSSTTAIRWTGDRDL